MTTTPTSGAADLLAMVSKALREAYNLGQRYWQQADSEYISQHKKAGDTRATFLALVEETCATLAAGQATAAQAGEYPALVCDYCGALTPDPWHSSGMLHGKMSKHIHSCDACAARGVRDGVASVSAGSESMASYAIRLLVAAALITQAKADEALRLAAELSAAPGPADGESNG